MPLVVVGLAAWQWKDLSDLRHDDSERAAFLTTARQGALNLTTIRWDNADSDVQRILDGSGGKFHDDFASRSASFVAVVKQAKSTSQGEITEAGIESVDHDTAQVIVAANVKTTHVGGGGGGRDQDPQSWRLRMTVHRTADRMLVTDVEFVP
ncbi:mammalian cell entry protein [Nocardia nova]|uniref:Mammalian cell entry protein n=1 Tax=Nocardia nova TaxID=37330 RepID=A0A2S6AMT1_9NOCA|nr:mammalian cell entry protein [Nocardia nova]